MVQTVMRALREVDLIAHVVDISRPPRNEDLHIAQMLRRSGQEAILIGNKSDLVANTAGRLDPYLDLASYRRHFIVSADPVLSALNFEDIAPRHHLVQVLATPEIDGADRRGSDFPRSARPLAALTVGHRLPATGPGLEPGRRLKDSSCRPPSRCHRALQ